MGPLYRPFLLGGTCVLTVWWLRAVYSPHDPVADPHGYGELFRLIILSGLHLIVGVVLLIASQFGVVRTRFAVLVILAPIAHLAGTPFEMPLCLVLFTVPSVAILLTALLELTISVGPCQPVDNEP